MGLLSLLGVFRAGYGYLDGYDECIVVSLRTWGGEWLEGGKEGF